MRLATSSELESGNDAVMITPALPGATETVFAPSALVIAPHFDDEVLGCGGLLAQLVRRGAAVRVLFLSDGTGGVEAVADRAAYGRRRGEEAEQACAVLGLAGHETLGLPDGRLAAHGEEIRAALERSLLTFRPRLLLAPSPVEVTADHRAAFDALGAVLSPVRRGDDLETVTRDLEVLLYEVNRPGHPDLLVDVGAEVATIERAMACYASQEARHPYLQAALGLRRYRALSLAPGTLAVEAYRRLQARDFQLMAPSVLARELGAEPAAALSIDGPAISVIVRTKDRPRLLAEALASLAASAYRRLEVVVVNDGGATVEIASAFPHPVVRVDLAPGRGRAAAANAGLEAATGAFVSFLDDDDLVEPDHFEILAGLVAGTGVEVAYTDAAVGIWELGEKGWARAERRLPYSRDYDPDLLAVDNYIPLLTLVIERSAARAAGVWDESFPFFEDWEWLIRLAALAPFHHHRRVTCEYRHFRAAEQHRHALGEAPRQRADFLAMKARVLEKHAAALAPERLARAVDRLRAEAVEAGEEVTRLLGEARTDRAARQAAEARYHQARGEIEAARGHVALLEADTAGLGEEVSRLRSEAVALRAEIERRDGDLRRLYGDEKALRATVEEQNAHLGRVYAEIQRLERVVQTMEATRAWRAHAWWQRRVSRAGSRGG